MQYHIKAHGEATITLDNLCRKKWQQVHGRPVWRDNGDGTRTELAFDAHAGDVVSREIFAARQADRREQARAESKKDLVKRREQAQQEFGCSQPITPPVPVSLSSGI